MNEKSSLKNVLRQLMDEVGVTEAELSRYSDIPQPTLHRILSGATRSPRGQSLAPLANFFSITINQLMGVDPLPNDRVPGTYNPRIHGWKSVPVINWKQAAIWPEFKKEQMENWSDWTSTDLPVSDDAFAIHVQGDAMAPRFAEDTLLIIEPQRAPINKDFIVVVPPEHSTAVFKQFMQDGEAIYLRSLNEDFRTQHITDKPPTICGTMVQARMDFYKAPVPSAAPDDE